MSNPYDRYVPGPPDPHGEYASYGAGRGPQRLDGISIAALVCSLTCCAAPIGIGLGIAGIVRTKDGRRAGRWAAVTGLVVGVVLTIAMIAFAVFAGVMGARTLWEDEARVGQCLDVDFLDDQIEADCADPHVGEVIWVGRFDDPLVKRFESVGIDEFCGGLPGLEAHYRDALDSGDYQADISIDAFDEDEPGDGDRFYCYLERTDGAEIDGPLSQTGDESSARS